jgi:hypothetical protein
MGLGSGSTARTMALITAVCLLWVYPFCLFHQASASAFQRVIPSDLDHSSSSLVLCDDSHLDTASSSSVTGAGGKAGLGLYGFAPSTIPCEHFSVIRIHELTGSLFPASRSASLIPSTKLHILYAVYQI